MKKKILILLLSMAMFVTMMPTMAFAGTQNPCAQQPCSHEARIGTTHYDTLAEAITAAAAETADEIVLLKDVTVSSRVYLPKGDTLNGNGKKITGSDAGIILAKEGGTVKNLTVPSIHNTNGTDYHLEGTMTITGCTFEGGGVIAIKALQADNSNVVIKNNTFKSTSAGGTYQQYIVSPENKDSSITIQNNKFYNGTTTTCGVEVRQKYASKLVIDHNYIDEEMKALLVTEDTSVDLFAKMFPFVGENLTTEATGVKYFVNSNTAIYYTSQAAITAAGKKALIGAKGYATLADAVAAVKTGETITLLDNSEGITVNNDKTFTIDLNGHNITSSSGVAMNITKGVVTMNGTGTVSGGSDTCSVYVSGSGTKLVVNGGTYTSINGNVATIHAYDGGVVDIYGGTFKGTPAQTAGAKEGKVFYSGTTAATVHDGAGVVNVYGGSFTGRMSNSNWGEYHIYGGTFDRNAVQKYNNPRNEDGTPKDTSIDCETQITMEEAGWIADGYAVQKISGTEYKVVANTSYTVTFNPNGGTYATATTETVLSGQKANKPADPTRTGYKVVGWYTSPTPAAADKAWDFSTNTVTANTTLYAKWEAIKYNVAFYKNDTAATGTMTTQQLTYGTAANLNANAFKKDGYVFAGWNTSSTAAATGTAYADKQSVINLSSTENATVYLYAQWKKQTDAATGGEAKADLTENVAINSTTKTSALTIGSNDVANIMKEVKAAQSTAITINAVSAATGAAAVTTADVTIPATFVTELVKTGAPVQNVAIATNVGTVSFDATALTDIATKVAAAKGTAVTVEIKKGEAKNDTAKGEIYQDYELSVKSNDTAKTVINEFGGGVETVTVAIPATLTGKAIGVLYVKDGKVVEGVKSAKGTGTVTFSTTHNSTYRLTTADSAAAAVKPLVNAATVAQSKLYAYKNGKIKVAWKAAEGYDVDSYRIYRSTKKSSGYKKVGEVKAGTLKFVNAKSLKKGTKYYYKVRGVVQLDNGKNAYTAYSNVKYIKCKKTVK